MSKLFYVTLGLDNSLAGPIITKMKKTRGIVTLELASGPAKEPKPNGALNGGGPRARGAYEATGQQAIAKILNGKPPMTTPQLRDAFAAMGRSPASIASCIDTMKKAGEVAKGPQGYTLTKKMRDRLRHAKGKK